MLERSRLGIGCDVCSRLFELRIEDEPVLRESYEVEAVGVVEERREGHR